MKSSPGQRGFFNYFFDNQIKTCYHSSVIYYFSSFCMNTLSKVGYSALGSALAISQTFAADGSTLFGGSKDTSKITGAGGTAENAVQSLVGNAMAFLGIVAVLYGIYGGFLIVTAGGDDGKVKTGRTILIQVAIGLIVIFLANSIIQWVLSRILTGA